MHTCPATDETERLRSAWTRETRMTSSTIERDVYRLPMYTPPQAARIVAVPPATLRNWVQGYSYKTLGGVVEAFPLITTARVGSSRAPSLPFLGLAEAYVLAAFRAAGVPMQRIRPAIHWLDENIGLPAALASERLKTDGAEILYDFSRQSSYAEPDAASAVEDLVVVVVVVRNPQRVFVPVVSDYLRTVSYREGYVEQIRLPQYQMIDVIVDPADQLGDTDGRASRYPGGGRRVTTGCW